MNRAVAYCRVSTLEQVQHGVSLDAQEERLRAYCVLRGLEIAAVIRDEGVSGSKKLEKRPGGAEALRLVARRDVSHVVVAKLDRAFRNAADALTVTEAWDRAGVSLHILDMGGATLDTSTAMGRFFLTMAAGFAELERGLISERTRTALAHKREKGSVYGSTPFGFVREGDRLREHRQEMATVSRIHSLAREGVSVRAITERLNAEGVPAKRGGRWNKTTVHYVLRNQLYQGVTA